MKNKKLILLLAVVMVIAFGVVSCSETQKFKDEALADEGSSRVNAIETSYEVILDGDEYGGVMYAFPRIEGMTNMSKQADANGNMKRFNTRTTKDNSGVRGTIAESYEVLVQNDKLFSIIFPTTLDVDIPTRAMVMLVEAHKFLYTIDNLFGRSDGTTPNPMFGDARAAFEAAGADTTQTDDEFRQNLIYFKADATNPDDMTALELHMTYFKDGGQDIMVSFSDVADYLKEGVPELFDFAIE